MPKEYKTDVLTDFVCAAIAITIIGWTIVAGSAGIVLAITTKIAGGN
jgi:hypothetical protein